MIGLFEGIYVPNSDTKYVTYADIYPLSSLQTTSCRKQSPYHSKYQIYTQKWPANRSPSPLLSLTTLKHSGLIVFTSGGDRWSLWEIIGMTERLKG